MPDQNPLRAALWMSGAVLSFSLMALAVRELLRHMGAFEILFLRTLVTMLLVGAAIAHAGTATLRTQLFRFHLARALMHLGGQYCWIYAIGALTLATVFAIEFTMPVWVGVLATLFLGERMNRGRVAMLVLGLAGIAIILRPDLGALHPAALVMLLGSAFYAGNMIMTKRISATDSPLAVLFWMSLTQLPLTFVTALPQWVWPSAVDLLWAVVLGAGSFIAHYSMTRAMKLGDATLVVPIDFLRLPLIALIGALVYGESLEAATFIGAAVIFAGTYYSLARNPQGITPALDRHAACGTGGMDATHLNCPACAAIRPIRFEPLLPGEPSLGTRVCCAHCRRHAFTLLKTARFYCEICDDVRQALIERVEVERGDELGVLLVCGGCFDAKAMLYASTRPSPFAGASASDPPPREPPAGRAPRG